MLKLKIDNLKIDKQILYEQYVIYHILYNHKYKNYIFHL